MTAEVDVTGGVSSQEIAAAATQFRAFGDVAGGWQFFVEGALAGARGEESDAFGAAYPYEGGMRVIEAYAEQLLRGGRLVAGVRAGRFRTPFGMYNRGDHAYIGFLRAPLVRYDGYFALSNNYLEHGAAGFIGTSHVLVESSIGAPADVGEVSRRSGADAVLRVQGHAGPFIIGVSHLRTQPYLPETFALGESVFTGVDGRWMAGGVQIRGEWLFGRPFDGTSTDGGYLDVIVHRPGMGPVTAVFRTERIDYDTVPKFALHARRETAGARLRLPLGLSVQVDVVHHTSQVAYGHPWAVDVGVTYSVRQRLRPAPARRP
jgi:hypothetical protein